MTQHQKIIHLCADGLFHCQNEFRALYIFSPHKRRSEIEKKGEYRFEFKKCEHGVAGQRDYRMIALKPKKIAVYTLQETGKEVARVAVDK